MTKFHKKSLIISFISIILLLGVNAGFAQSGLTYTYTSGKAEIQTDSVIIKVTGGSNVPYYQLSVLGTSTSDDTSQQASETEQETSQALKIAQTEPTDPATADKDEQGLDKYIVKFGSLSEFVDADDDGQFDANEKVQGSTINFPSTSWDFSDFQTENDSSNNVQKIHFNFTHSGTPHIQLRNHIDVANSNEIKFDIIIKDYTWTSDNENAKLAVEMQVNGGALQDGSNGKDLVFGNAYVNFVDTATGENGDVNVAVSMGSSNKFSFVYDNFGANLDHDPTFGAVPGGNIDNTGDDSSVSLELLPIIGSFAVISIIYKRKRE